MDIPPSKPKQLSISGALSALFILLAVMAMSSLFCVGVIQAASLDGRMPSWLHPYAEAYSRPAHFAANLPVVQIPARLGINFGYDFADGPDTTR